MNKPDAPEKVALNAGVGRAPELDLVARLRTRNGRPDGFGLGPVCDEAADEIERLRAALVKLSERIKDHPAYADLTESEESDIGGDTAELSYLARVADGALRPNAPVSGGTPSAAPKVGPAVGL